MRRILFLLVAALPASTGLAALGTATVTGQNAGPTPFIAEIQVSVAPAGSLSTVQFTVSPKQGSVTRPISATYDIPYLQSRGNASPDGGTLSIPVFGLYASFSNTVTLKFVFTDGLSQQTTVMVATPAFADPCHYTNPIVVQPRTNSTTLSYDFALLKAGGDCESSPTIVDTDGAVRWVGTGHAAVLGAIFFDNAFYVSSTPANSSNPTAINRIEWDGTFSPVRDYANQGITNVGHHNYDRGRDGILVEVDTTQQTESVIIEIDKNGNILRTWSFADIISAAMRAGGDDPSQFVFPVGTDWFHNNAATYRRSDNTLIVSSRENFVIAVDYDTKAIKWILGDPTKKWFQFPSLRAFALTVPAPGVYPIGEHALSIASDGNLLLFDNGRNSFFQTPMGANRTESVPRKYRIDTQAKTATELFNYHNNPPLFSPFCSSIYEDAPLDYLIDYAIIMNLPNGPYSEIMGLDNAANKVFDYRYPTVGCGRIWNAVPIHLENISLVSQAPTTLPLKNGNFETQPTNIRGSIPGWTVTGPGHTAAQNEGYTSASHSATFSEGGDFTGDSISQRFVAVPGTVYTVSFQAGVFGTRSGNPQTLRVQVKGNAINLDQTVTPPEAGTSTPSLVKFQRFSFNFTADSTVETLQLTDTGTSNPNADVVVDDVAVVAVPKPLPLTNGNFESQPTNVRGSIPAWTVTGPGHTMAQNEGYTSASNSATFSEGGDFTGDSISQSFAATPGTVYTVSFQAGIFGVRSGNPQTLRVQVRGNATNLDQTVTPPEAGTINPLSVRFQRFSFNFTADSTVETLQLTDTGTSNPNADVVVDDVSVVVAAPGTLINGNFETSPTRVRGSIPGWTVTGPGHAMAQNEGFTSSSNSATFSEGGDFTGDSISQDFSAVPGKTYTVSFQAGIFGIRSGNPQTLRVQVRGNTTNLDQTVTPFEVGTENPSLVQFQKFSFNFIADTNLETLQLTDTGTANPNADVVVDDVSITPAP